MSGVQTVISLIQQFYSASAIIQVFFHSFALIALFACAIVVLLRRSALYTSGPCALLFSRDSAIYLIALVCSAGM